MNPGGDVLVVGAGFGSVNPLAETCDEFRAAGRVPSVLGIFVRCPSFFRRKPAKRLGQIPRTVRRSVTQMLAPRRPASAVRITRADIAGAIVLAC